MIQKVLLLDVDGVLNNYQEVTIQKPQARNLLEVVIETKCSIILSSAWRYPGSVSRCKYAPKLKEQLAKLNAPDDYFEGLGFGSPFWVGLTLALGEKEAEVILSRVVGATPKDLTFPGLCEGSEPRRERRDETILRWVKSQYREPEKWVAVDDLPCIHSLGPAHSLVTRGAVGLTYADSEKLIEMLS